MPPACPRQFRLRYAIIRTDDSAKPQPVGYVGHRANAAVYSSILGVGDGLRYDRDPGSARRILTSQTSSVTHRHARLLVH